MCLCHDTDFDEDVRWQYLSPLQKMSFWGEFSLFPVELIKTEWFCRVPWVYYIESIHHGLDYWIDLPDKKTIQTITRHIT